MKWSHYWANNAVMAIIVSHLHMIANAIKPSVAYMALGVFWVVLAMVAYWKFFDCKRKDL